MIGRVYRLKDAKCIEMNQREIQLEGDCVLVKPDYMSICAADGRYYFGRRKREVLNHKLPMALIHEATATVIYDYSGTLKQGDKVVLVPLETTGNESKVKDNYRRDSIFASSDSDGFMRDLIALPHSRIIDVTSDYSIVYVFSEILSVAVAAVSEFEKSVSIPAKSFGIWGDGSMGYVTGLAIRAKYPDAKIHIFGKTARKLQKFSFAADTHFINQIPNDLVIDHAFECVGGTGSEDAINQMIELISPQGTVSLLGVSEEAIPINTRRMLEKGLKLIGNSRSDYNDFNEAINIIRNNSACKSYLQMLISEVVEVKNESDISKAFEQYLLNDFKTVIKWNI